MASGLESVRRWLSFASVAVEDRPRRGDIPAGVWPDGDPSQRNSSAGSRRYRLSGRWVRISYALIDLFLVCLDGAIAFSLRFWGSSSGSFFRFWHGHSFLGLPVTHYVAFLILYAAVILLFCQSQDLYRTVRTRTAMQESFAVLKAVFCATLLLSAFVYLSGVEIVSRLVVGCAGILNVLTFISWRLWKRQIIIHRAAKGIGTRNVLIVGAGRIGQALADVLERNKLLGYSFKGFLDVNHSTHPKLLGKIEDLPRIAKSEFADEVFISIPSERELVKRVAADARCHRLAVKVVPDLYDGLGWNAPITHVGTFPVMELHWEPIPTFGLFLKRIIDVFGAAVGLVLTSPIVLGAVVCIRLSSKGPAIYSSLRVGRKGRRFVCHKLRTMVQNADDLKSDLRRLNEREGPTFKIASDPRITRVGGFLRKYSIDELPQLWDVLRGEMSLVGPRPHPIDDYEQYGLEHLRRLDVKPGVTGLWQVTARRHPSFEANMRLDIDYIEHWTLLLDLKILLKTFQEIVCGSGS